MRIGKARLNGGEVRLVVVEEASARVLDWTANIKSLTDLLHAKSPVETARTLLKTSTVTVPVAQVTLLAPLDQQEVWAAGVTYKRSQVARMEESETGASHYDRVYTAPRPELFFKATPHRVAGPGQPVRIRVDTKWSVPEPEFTLIVSPDLRLVGYTIGYYMSARDIVGENPLYLPQAKLYNDCCALGPCILLADAPLDRPATKITLTITRSGKEVFRGQSDLDQMKRGFEELISWLGKDNSFPNGAILLTGTGVVPPNEFTLAAGDIIAIDIVGIGTLTNPVVQG
ncbi:MAG: fumarylacetoacetate hydrolase family protein [Planctomycetales bacterium]|nr:fumarylacetoacetate hydrolase family protein [Planctomycetales bacterium]